MVSKIILDDTTRSNIFDSLTEKQKDFLEQHVKRGKKTAFANVMALDKGIVLPEHATDTEIQAILDEWVLIEYIDNGERNADTPCECGRPLHYQYIVQHQTTKETRRFGITHFAEHTGLPPHIVKQIKDGFAAIDYERDELLVKLQNNWCLEDELSYLPDGFSFPADIHQQLDAGLPLLDTQFKRLRKEISLFLQELHTPPRSLESVHDIGTKQDSDQISLDLFQEGNNRSTENQVKPSFEFTHTHQETILHYLQKGVSSAWVLCELLMKEHDAPKDRYTTRKPRMYVPVCKYLDELVKQRTIRLVEIDGKLDRIYQWIGISKAYKATKLMTV
ncbi:hypothetical protein CN345_07080 [Bacillus thuringiensis]|uniref:DUF3895 domain-containing protein n=1 Tax=Bacillus thuringiensis TaxID=1428 RepID=UPI000BF57702|nr:DUF3895 domain-containing protein [Bacillus thuringiensis]PEZ41805.1 hypothetical protein CN345_07080 [Bacillus thuringiensis]PGY51084.1 hypothetical protein COE09_18050 [Bacillus thuringiensis]